jgi:hypothetical protein
MACWIDLRLAWQVILSSGYWIPFERAEEMDFQRGWFARRRLRMKGGLNSLP